MKTMPFQRRVEKLIAKFDKLEIDGILIQDLPGVRYFSGFSGSHGRLIISKNRTVLFTDQRYTEQAGIESPEWDIYGCGADVFTDLITAIKETGITSLGFESDVVTVAEYEKMKTGLNSLKLIPTSNLSIEIRAVKDESEISCIREALEIAETAFLELTEEIEPGMTEKAVAARLENLMFQHGSEKPAFETIVACGANSSKPHHTSCGDTIAPIDAVLLDFGAQVGGYKSDITRMIYIGEEPEAFMSISRATEKALRAVESVLKPGMTGVEADSIAREVFISCELEEYTLRGLGHGVGLEIHEWPRVTMNSKIVLSPGMICTLEPGVYIPGKAGVRMENLALITETGAEILNKTPLTITITMPRGLRRG